MDNTQRRKIYLKQRNGGKLTARQERRIRQKPMKDVKGEPMGKMS